MKPSRTTGALAGVVTLTSLAGLAATTTGDDSTTPETITLNAVIRDFKAYNENGGHDDFQRYSGTTRVGLVEDELGADGKPALASQTGLKMRREFLDTAGRHVRPQFIIDGTIPGEIGRLEVRTDNRIYSPESFASWFSDVPGTNMSTVVPFTLAEESPGSGIFVFDSSAIDPDLNPRFADLPIQGFFPINGELFGNYSGYDNGSTNFHFTTEIATTFLYRRGEDYVFTFTGDDDVWVFIDGKLVIDMGSLHSRKEQTITLDALDWLESGETYSLHIFHAERRTSASNFRMETTIPLRPYAAILVNDAFD